MNYVFFVYTLERTPDRSSVQEPPAKYPENVRSSAPVALEGTGQGGSHELPYDIDAERQVLGALLVRPDLIIQTAAVLGTDDFYLESHRLVFESVVQVYQSGSGLEVEPVGIIQYLKDRGLLEKAGGGPYILKLSQDVMAPSNALIQARRLKNIYLRRELVKAAREIEDDAVRPQEDENVFLKKVEDRILGITNRSMTAGIIPAREIKSDFIEYFQSLQAAQGGMTGLATHFTEFDGFTSGLRGGELVILAARPGMGKTTFAMNIAANIALLGKQNVIIYSLEMSRLELMLRMVASQSMYNLADLKRGKIEQGKVQHLLNTIEDIFAAPINIDDTGTLDIWDCIARSRKMALDLNSRGEKLGLIIVDYLQLLTDPENKKHGRQQEVSAISRSLKQLAKATDTPILALSQMNRSVEQRRGDTARPQLSDLRESGAIEQDADMVLFIHREMVSEQDVLDDPEKLEARGTAEVIIAKHRNGPVGSFRVAFRPEINRFDNRPQMDDDIGGGPF